MTRVVQYLPGYFDPVNIEATTDRMGYIDGYQPVQFCLVGHGHDNIKIVCAADGCERDGDR